MIAGGWAHQAGEHARPRQNEQLCRHFPRCSRLLGAASSRSRLASGPGLSSGPRRSSWSLEEAGWSSAGAAAAGLAQTQVLRVGVP